MPPTSAQPPFARLDGNELRTASYPLRVAVQLSARTLDDEMAAVSLLFQVTAARDDADRQLLREQTEAAGGVLELQALAASLTPELRAVWERVAARSNSETLARADVPRELIDAAARWAFSRGIEMGRDVQQRVEFPDRAVRARALALEQQNADAAAARLRMLEGRASLRGKIESLRADDADAAAILAQLSPLEQSEALAMLATPTPQASLLVVGGTRLMRLSLADASSGPTLHTLPGTLGPARSVRELRLEGRDLIAVGMQSGIHLLDRQTLELQASLLAGEAAATFGFNAIAELEGTIVASHSQLGVLCWNTLSPSMPQWSIAASRLPAGPRLLVATDHAAVFAAGSQVFGVDCAGAMTPLGDPPGEILAMRLNAVSRLHVVTSEGQLCSRGLAADDAWQSRAIASAIEQASAIHTAGQWRWLVRSAARVLNVSGDDAALLSMDNLHAAYAMLGREALAITIAADRQRFSIHDLSNRVHVRDLHAGTLLQARIADATIV